MARAASRTRGDIPMVLVDCCMVIAAYTTLLLLRFEFAVPADYWRRFSVFLTIALLVHVLANRFWGAYGKMWRHASVDEARVLLLAGTSTALVLLAAFTWQVDRVPISVVLVGPVIATILMGAARFQYRLFAFRRSAGGTTGMRVAVVGAGSAGAIVIREMQSSDRMGMTPVVLLDDDRRLAGRSLHGVPIAGGIADLERAVQEYDVHQVLIAMPSQGPAVTERVAKGAAAAGVGVKVLPHMADMIHRVSVKEARDLGIDDLLGRRQAHVGLEDIRALLHGRRVLVTGGGGSIGAEVAHQVAGLGPAALVLLDHDETHLHETAQALAHPTEQVLADVRDRHVLDDVFGRVQPEVVFHAAAHKHVPILERHACQAIATNVFGTANVVGAAQQAGTESLVLVSTDKAAAPASVMGASKWLAEQVLLAHAPAEFRYCSVRFGNVVGSRGSVIPTFEAQIAAGGPVTVTDPRMTRFFMSTREAVSLVLEAASVCENHEIFMLEMGEPVNILELARRMIELCGYTPGTDIPIEITGIRPGERLSEELRGPGEQLSTTRWPSILVLHPLALARNRLEQTLDELADLVHRGDDEQARATLLKVAGGIPHATSSLGGERDAHGEEGEVPGRRAVGFLQL